MRTHLPAKPGNVSQVCVRGPFGRGSIRPLDALRATVNFGRVRTIGRRLQIRCDRIGTQYLRRYCLDC
jgi:hypothetical protein